MNMIRSQFARQSRYGDDLERALAHLPPDADIDQATLNTAFFATPYAVFLLDQSARVLVYNRRAERMFEAPSEEDGPFQGRDFRAFTGMTHDEVDEALRAGAARGTAEFQMRTAGKMRALRPTLFRVALLRSTQRKERLYLLTQDHLRAAADALGQMNKRRVDMRKDMAKLEARFVDLHACLMAMETFAHKASHDLRTPLSTLSGMLHLTTAKYAPDLPDKGREYLAVMQRAVAQMDALTTDFLEHARSATAELAAEPVVLRDVLDEVRVDLQNGLTPSEVSFDIQVCNCTVMAEPTMLRMVVANLLGNALKYRHPERRLRVEVSTRTGADATTCLRIADNGRGFDPAQRNAIFRAFHRASHAVEGTGMGLSTCKEVCRRHGWDISAESDGQSGAVFEIRFPTMTAHAKSI